MMQDKTIIRKAHDKDNPYVIIDRTIFEDDSISWKAKGLMGYFLSRPDDWKIWLSDLVKRSTDGRYATRSALSELEKAGYITKQELRDEKGRFAGNEILVHESPLPEDSRTVCGFPTTDNPTTENPTSENQTHTNNNNTNNNYTNNNKNPPPSGDILEYHMTDETDSEFDCVCGNRIVIAKLSNANACCSKCMQSIRVFNWLDAIVKKPPQKARRKESGFTGGLDGFDDKPFKAFCVIYGIPFEGMPVKKVRQWANQIKNVADTFDADCDTTYQAIKAIKGSEHAWKTYASPYVASFQELLGVMIARVKAGDIDTRPEPLADSPAIQYLMQQNPDMTKEQIIAALKAQSQ